MRNSVANAYHVADANADGYADGHTYTDCHTYSNSHGHTYTHFHAQGDANAEITSNATGSSHSAAKAVSPVARTVASASLPMGRLAGSQCHTHRVKEFRVSISCYQINLDKINVVY